MEPRLNELTHQCHIRNQYFAAENSDMASKCSEVGLLTSNVRLMC